MKRLMLACLAASFATATSANAEEDVEKIGILATLGLTAADGKTELKDGAGEIEGWLVAASAIEKSAIQISKHIVDASSNQSIVLLHGEQSLDVSAYAVANGQINATANLAAAASLQCPADGAVGILAAKDGGGRSSVEIANALIGALKVSTSIQSYDIASADGAMANAVATALTAASKTVIFPKELALPLTDSPLLARFVRLDRIHARLKQCKQSDDVKAALAAIDQTKEGLLKPGKDDAPSVLSRALQSEPIAQLKPLVLRTKVEKAGGSIINRSNIFLQFGFPGALSITGGLVVSYRLVDPTKGQNLASGLLACRMVEQDLSAFHQIRKKPRKAATPDCTGPQTPVPAKLSSTGDSGGSSKPDTNNPS